VHSEYSTLDGLSKVHELLDTAKSLGQTHLAITDHGSTSGLWEAQEYADKIGMRIIHGSEFYYEREGDGKNGHLLVLAKNDKGLENIFKMQEYGYVHNFYRKPRINFDVLIEHKEGLIVTSACLGSAFNQFIMEGQVDEAIAWARKFKEAFGEDFYIELQPNQIPEQHLCNTTGIRIAKQLGIELVATNDVHYTYETDCFPHEVLLAMQLKAKMGDEKRFKFSTDDFWLKSEKEMFDTFTQLDSGVVQEAIANTQVIANKCTARIHKGKFLPKFYATPEGMTEGQYLQQVTADGLVERLKDTRLPTSYVTDVNHELDVIDRNGYSGYFLVVQDFVNSAKERGELVGDGRGSGAGSKTAWLTAITEIPPHEYDLLFERFMADGREPDFDVDFSDQDAVFEDLATKYGRENVARIVAFGKMKPKAVIRKVFSAFEHPGYLINEITKLVPDLCVTLEEAYAHSPQILTYKAKHRVEWEVIERLVGVISHESQHAGGVIIYPDLSSILPIKTIGADRTKRIVGWDKKMLEKVGHFKFDILGLETLPILHRTLESIRESTGEVLDLRTIDLEDQAVYDMLCAGDVSGVFQLNNQAQKVMEQQPRSFRDIIAINALIRPGVGDWDEYMARRKGKEWSVYAPRMPYMEETVGTMTYQEQFLLDAHILAGWDIAYADKHIRKNQDIRNDTDLCSKFIEDCTRNGHPEDVCRGVWEEICDAVDGGYSFNKSHSASYGVTSYQTAYLKCHYPLHFYASLMSSEKTDGEGQDAVAGQVAECKRRGIAINPPDINLSNDNFVVTNDSIAFRITTVKHVGDSAIAHINELRPIKSFDDFMERRNKSLAKKNTVINLIKAGAFDFDNGNRAHLMWKFEMSQRTKTQIKEDHQIPEHTWDDKTKTEWEKEVLGMYLSLHPLERYSFAPLSKFKDGDFALQGGEIYDTRIFKDKNQNEMAFVHINTLHGNVKLLFFARQWSVKAYQKMVKVGNILLVRGKRSGNDQIVDSVELLEGELNE
jgi:DNA polymerase-3 subunit alpha